MCVLLCLSVIYIHVDFIIYRACTLGNKTNNYKESP